MLLRACDVDELLRGGLFGFALEALMDERGAGADLSRARCWLGLGELCRCRELLGIDQKLQSASLSGDKFSLYELNPSRFNIL